MYDLSLRIGWGEYFRPSDEITEISDAVKWHARLQFVEALESKYALKDLVIDDNYRLFYLLADDVLNKSREPSLIPKGWSREEALKTISSWANLIEYIGPLPPVVKLTQEEKLRNANPNMDAFEKHLRKHGTNNWKILLINFASGIRFWERTFNLGNQDWFCQMVIILFWRKALSQKEEWKLPTKHLQPALDFLPTEKSLRENKELSERASISLREGKHLNYKTLDWNPILETREKAKTRILSSFSKALTKHLDEKCELCEAIGFLKTPEKRNPEHFKWLALHLIRGLDYEAIAQEYTNSDPEGNRAIGTDAVRKAILSTAALIGLELQK